MKQYLSFFIVMLLCTGCQQHEIDKKTLIDKSPEDLYKLGHKYALANKPADAVLAFEEIENSHPYSRYVADSQIEAGYCHYKRKKYDDAISTLETFIQVHPTHKRVPEALYLLGNIYFDQMPIVKRDQENSVRALEYFQELCSRYPTSEFVANAETKIKILLQQIAHHEFRVGMHYQKRSNFPAAIARYNTIIESYPSTMSAQEAYLRLIECYLSMGLRNEAVAVNNALQRLHKDSKWAKYANKALQK